MNFWSNRYFMNDDFLQWSRFFYRSALPILILILSSCAHKKNSVNQVSEFTPEQLEHLNREALKVVSERLEAMVIQARNSESASHYLSTDLFLKGNMSLLEGDYGTARVLFKHLLALVPEDQFIQKKYAISLIRSGLLEESATVLEKLYSNTKDEKVGLILGGVYSGIDREESARKVYLQLLAQNPLNEEACIYLGKSLAIGKQETKAITQLRKCGIKNKNNGMYDYYIGKIQLDMGKVPEAMKSFQQAHLKQPDLSQAVNALGVLLEEREQHEAAIKIYKKYLFQRPEDTSILNRIVQILFIRERFLEVIPYAEKLIDLEPENLNLKVKLGILYTDAKKYPEAVSIFKDLLEVAPKSDKILYYLGVIKQEMKDYQDSIEYFNQISPESGLYTDSSIQIANMLAQLAQIEFEKKNSPLFIPRFIKFVNKKISEFQNMRVEFSIIKAGFYEGTGQYKEAMESVMIVQDEKGFSNQHKYYLANLFEKQKKYTESTAIVMSILDKEPKNAHAWNFLGYSLLERGEELDKAYEYIKKAMDISPDDGYIRDSLGWYYFKKGEVNRALIELELAFKKVPDDVEIIRHLAIVHKRLKNYKMAKTFFESALKLVKVENERNEILSQIKDIEGERIPASDKMD
jgi:tetratricopeptide (TPR) repeat protein